MTVAAVGVSEVGLNMECCEQNVARNEKWITDAERVEAAEEMIASRSRHKRDVSPSLILGMRNARVERNVKNEIVCEQ